MHHRLKRIAFAKAIGGLGIRNGIQPIGFQIAPGETKSSWFLFMEALKSAGINYDDLVINSDRFDGIVSAVKEFFPRAEHVFCSVHLERNIQDFWCNTYDQLTYDKGDEVSVDLQNGVIKNLTKNKEYSCTKYPQEITNLIEVGGLVNYTKQKLGV